MAEPVTHPGPAVIELPEPIRRAIVAQARAEDPNEACGILVGSDLPARGGRALRYEPARNAAASPLRYLLDTADLYRISVAADDADQVIWGIVHSHTHTPAVPSPTDIRSATYPDALYLLVSLDEDLADPVSGAPSLRAWRIVDGGIFEVEVRA